MSKTDLEKFERRLGLSAYFMHLFGVDDPTDERQVRDFLKGMSGLKEGYDGGRSYVATRLASTRGCKIPTAKLFEYDRNIHDHIGRLNKKRDRPITLKYFQMLAAFCAEVYLDRVTSEPEKFRHDVNLYFHEANEDKGYHYQFALFDEDELDGSGKLAYWMATGSGKTLVMHLNYYQWLHYAERRDRPVDNILLLTPNAGLTRQHMEEMEQSSIACRYFHDPDDGRPDVVKVLEITKLSDDASGSGERVDIDAFEGNNLIFVDEGHKGASGDSWMEYRRRIARQGFTFEYSATFGQAIAGGATDLQHDYGKAIALNYSYPYFHEDGYGKDYHILNLERDVDDALTDRYLLANVLTFVEQKLCYGEDPELARRTYNIAEPLLIFVGNSVTAGKTLGSLGTNEKRSLTDVQKLVVFLDRLLRNEGGWATDAIDLILSGDSGLLREDGTDLFENVFGYLKGLVDEGWDAKKIYAQMLERVFHTDTSAPLELVNLAGADGELGLRAGSTDRYFGVIDIGNERAFMALAEEELPEVHTDEDAITASLFQDINQQDSDVQILLGSRKFIEGWSSWRVSAMGLMNFGQSPGPMIIQLFGRGVRLLGKKQSLKRSRELEGNSPAHIQLLEKLHIFGVRARYMSEFRKYLEREGIDVREWEELAIPVPVEAKEDLESRGLVTPRIEADPATRFVDEVVVSFRLERSFAPTVDLLVTGEDIDSEGRNKLRLGGGHDTPPCHISARALMLFDWETLENRLWQYARSKGYENLVMSADDLQSLFQERGYYRLYCPPTMLDVDDARDVRRVERIAHMIVVKYVDNLVSHARKDWEKKQRNLVPLDRNDPNFISPYRVNVLRTTQIKKVLEELELVLQKAGDELHRQDGKLPPRVYFEPHLYTPLLVEDDAARTHKLSGQLNLSFSPPGLNDGEVRFIRALANFTKSGLGTELLQDYELSLLRNQSRGSGVHFPVQPYEGAAFENVYPDFIVWLKSPTVEHIIFIEPHGLTHDGNIFDSAKVRLHQTIKEDEAELAEKSGRDDVRFHSFVISTTQAADLPTQVRDETFDELRAAGVYFPDREPNYLTHLFEHVIESQALPTGSDQLEPA